jgi:thiamine-phosphate pyrophosphorylase
MQIRQPIPDIWLISDARNDTVLETALAKLPRGSGFIYRHYHLDDAERVARFQKLAYLARKHCHLVILADSAITARAWGADGIYGAPRALYPRRIDMLQLATAHDLAEIGLANRFGADAVLLSPVFTTRSHPDADSIGPVRFRMLARHAKMPVIALGGMAAERAKTLDWLRWAAIDSLS